MMRALDRQAESGVIHAAFLYASDLWLFLTRNRCASSAALLWNQWLSAGSYTRSVLFSLVEAEVKLKYSRSVLGIFWAFVIPVAEAACYRSIIGVLTGRATDTSFVVLVGLVLVWNAFSRAVLQGIGSLLQYRVLAARFPIPLPVFPLACVLVSLVDLIAAIPLLVFIGSFSAHPVFFEVFCLVPQIIILLTMAYLFSAAFSVMHVFFSDVGHVMRIVLRLWFFSTPVLFGAESLKQDLKWILYVNPVGMLFVRIREILSGVTVTNSWRWLSASTVWLLVLSIMAWAAYRTTRRMLRDLI